MNPLIGRACFRVNNKSRHAVICDILVAHERPGGAVRRSSPRLFDMLKVAVLVLVEGGTIEVWPIDQIQVE
jgi:hypothetical protein